MSINTQRNMSAESTICQLIAEAQGDVEKHRRSESRDRRSEKRYAFFRPVSIHIDGHCYSGFCREISATSIGLMHYFELSDRDAEVSIHTESGSSGRLPVRIERCEPCGAGWYLSGCGFVGIDAVGGRKVGAKRESNAKESNIKQA